VTPAFDPALAPGVEVAIPDWTTVKSPVPLAPGAPANLVLLRPLGDDRYQGGAS